MCTLKQLLVDVIIPPGHTECTGIPPKHDTTVGLDTISSTDPQSLTDHWPMQKCIAVMYGMNSPFPLVLYSCRF